jgi:hypothetical protein
VSAADTDRPDTNRPDTRPRFRKQQPGSHGVRGVRFRSLWVSIGGGVRLPGRLRQKLRRTRSRRCGATAGPRTLGLLVCAGHLGQVDT